MGEGETKDDEFPASAQLNYFFSLWLFWYSDRISSLSCETAVRVFSEYNFKVNLDVFC